MEMMRLTWALTLIMRDLIKNGAVDLSKLPESDRTKLGVMYSILDKAITESEGGSNK